ncbi:lipoyl domain-containing protein [Hyphomicrobium sp.]|uniref:lipoyl domain-containing protein n=1 Tax=Hyphomicrobium sp. TaxID=82 RepID=UPI000FB51D87|nr:lipoyl domain-containing protein [Hyphomicrobium sp.]RUP00449.1 MAG: biotin attachment protein [Hyphomicrobium sp.]
MSEIKVDEALWASSIFPEGMVVRWLIPDGSMVSAGRAVAEVRIEDALHEITAPRDGRITIVRGEHSVIDPGSLLATVGD